MQIDRRERSDFVSFSYIILEIHWEGVKGCIIILLGKVTWTDITQVDQVAV